MHEVSLARGLLAAALERLPASEELTIRTVRGRLAETEALSADSLAFHFAALARGTPAEGAALRLALVHVRARCLGCGAEYAPEHHLTICPDCGGLEGDLLGPTGLWIDEMDVAPRGASGAE